jgi:hypothetical protein
MDLLKESISKDYLKPRKCMLSRKNAWQPFLLWYNCNVFYGKRSVEYYGKIKITKIWCS